MKHTPQTVFANQEECSNFGRLLIEGAQDYLGSDNLMVVLQDFLAPRNDGGDGREHSFVCGCQDSPTLPSAEIEKFALAIKSLYGKQAGRGLMVRIGRSTFQQIIKHYGKDSRLLNQEFNVLPVSIRLPVGLERLAGVFTQHFRQPVEVHEQGSAWLWSVEHPQQPHDSHATNDPDCYLMVGVLQEFMTWASGGRFHRVVEEQCCISGSRTCVFRIDKKALD